MITRAYRLLKETPNPTEEEIRYWMAGKPVAAARVTRISSRRCHTPSRNGGNNQPDRSSDKCEDAFPRSAMNT